MQNKQFDFLSDLYSFLVNCQNKYLVEITWPESMIESGKLLENPVLVEHTEWYNNLAHCAVRNVLLRGKSANGKYFSWRFRYFHLTDLEIKVHIPLSAQGKAQKQYKKFLNELRRKQQRQRKD